MMLVYDARSAGYGCECGVPNYDYYPGERRRHKTAHDLWARGAALPRGFGRDRIGRDGIASVHESERGPEAVLASKLAHSARRAGGYDFASFYPGGSSLRELAPWSLAYLYVEDGRAVGYLRADAATHHGLFRPGTPRGQDRVVDLGFDLPPVPLAEVVFVCAEHRRRGVATRLLARFAADAGTALSALAWGVPFTTPGLALARSISGGELAIGDAREGAA
jgi:GNAT superfamily N-acetyltransferase